MRVLSGFVLLCILSASGGDLAAQLPFTEEAQGRGVFVVTAFGFGDPFGYGMAVNDLDGDGDLDLVTTGDSFGEVWVFENDGTGAFSKWPIPLAIDFDINGVACGDYDGDGDLDIFLASYGPQDLLLRNDGGLDFVDVTDSARLTESGSAVSASWTDFDADGWLDLYICNTVNGAEGSENLLYHNQQDGTFLEIGSAMGVADPHASFQAVFFDYDLDGDSDLYLSNDRSSPSLDDRNRLWLNTGGEFVEISDESGAGIAISSMGLDIADFDRDGDFDIFVTNTDDNPLLLQGDDLVYEDQTFVAEVGGIGRGWGTLFWDYDNDGFLDLFSVNSNSTNCLFDYDGSFPTTEVSQALDIADAPYTAISGSYCCAMGDIDGDGDLDMFVQSFNEPIALFINHEGETRNWLRVALAATGGNTSGVGSLVKIRVGSTEQITFIKSSCGFKSTSELVAHFGLDTALVVDELWIRWPDGALSLLSNVTANQFLTVEQSTSVLVSDCNVNWIDDAEEISLDPTLDLDQDGVIDQCGQPQFRRGEVNGDGSVDVADAISLLQALFSSGQPLPCLDAGDTNDDGALDIADAISLLQYLFSPPVSLPPPASECGVDPTEDSMECLISAGC